MHSEYNSNSEGIHVNGIRIYPFSDFDELIDMAVREKSICVALNSDKLSYSDDNLKQLINTNIGYCDGVGAVWAIKRKGYKGKVNKIAGCELWLEIIKRYPEKKYYLVGAENSVITETVSKLKREYPKIDIVGYRDGYFTDEEKPELFDNISKSCPDFVFAAMGSPKQEYFLLEMQSIIKVPMLGLGGSFNVYTGAVKRAPLWMLKLNLETPYRYLFCNIKWFRVKNDFKFLLKLALNKL